MTGDTEVIEATEGAAALAVSKDVTFTFTSAARGEFSATAATDLRPQRNTARKAANFEAYTTSATTTRGSLSSPPTRAAASRRNYFYRECVDFVAWRLNRDAGSTTAPFLYDWSYLTPSGGNASQWKYAWRSHAWPSSTTPDAGSVAYFSRNHVAYVKEVNADGTVLVGAYDFASDNLYSQRTIPSTDVELFLYPPPR